MPLKEILKNLPFLKSNYLLYYFNSLSLRVIIDTIPYHYFIPVLKWIILESPYVPDTVWLIDKFTLDHYNFTVGINNFEHFSINVEEFIESETEEYLYVVTTIK